MKIPEIGELWSDEIAWATKRRPRLLVVSDVSEGIVRGRPISGDGAGTAGVPVDDFGRTWSWQGYWSMTHGVLPRLGAPYEGHALSPVAKSRKRS